jgi:YggT family protein
MQDALHYLVDTILSLVFFVFLLRLLLQWVRADFRNPLAQAIVGLTNWLIMPLRRVLPPIGRIDSASVVAIVLIALLQVAAGSLLRGFGLPAPIEWLRLGALEIARTLLWVYFWAIFLYAMLSMLAPGNYSPAQSLLNSLCEPVLRPIRRHVPPLANLDLSPLWAGIGIQMLLILLR